ncbi:uncharacterized protein LOC107476277 [Arachis duranensis]|uniref:Uncharacterized protein LOC107476277 n=1 Tax=Arachis duranensis TaxID=130453 RepID=A0A6P4CJA6_ARADU|nr:uncharacterized protein LOC107476277 [Arachis duranensis]
MQSYTMLKKVLRVSKRFSSSSVAMLRLWRLLVASMVGITESNWILTRWLVPQTMVDQGKYVFGQQRCGFILACMR